MHRPGKRTMTAGGRIRVERIRSERREGAARLGAIRSKADGIPMAASMWTKYSTAGITGRAQGDYPGSVRTSRRREEKYRLVSRLSRRLLYAVELIPTDHLRECFKRAIQARERRGFHS